MRACKSVVVSDVKLVTQIGVYVSLVSTRIPYGGAHKEFIGDENEDLQKCVRDCIMKCCVQLKVSLRLQQIKDNRSLSHFIKYLRASHKTLMLIGRKRLRRSGDSLLSWYDSCVVVCLPWRVHSQ